jgi:hypothetical protein
MSIVNTMIEYQKIHNIKGRCITNTQILYDIIRATNPSLDIKIKAVIVIIDDTENNIMICNRAHMVLYIGNGNVIDASYEVASYKNSHYFTNIKDFISFCFKNYGKEQQIELWDGFGGIKKITEDFINFVNLSNEMNDNEFCVNKEYYDNLLNYIQEKHKNQIIMFSSNQLKKYLNK